MLGLVLGKTLGIAGAAWLAARLGVARLPEGATWPMMVAIAAVAGIGFTVSLFVAELAFPAGALADAAKIGVLGRVGDRGRRRRHGPPARLPPEDRSRLTAAQAMTAPVPNRLALSGDISSRPTTTISRSSGLRSTGADLGGSRWMALASSLPRAPDFR